VNVTQYIAGGFILTRRVARPSYVAEFLPPRILSASTCICPTLPDNWSLLWTGSDAADRQREAAAWGADFRELAEWTARELDAGGIGWPNVVADLPGARAFAQRVLPVGSEIVLLGLGLHETLAEQFERETTHPENQTEPGIRSVLARREPFPAPGRPLGHEVLCYDSGSFHSWLCNGLEKPLTQQLGTATNDEGLIDDLTVAIAAAEYCGRDDVGAEPGLWMPWLLVQYSLG
jgi:hypothetical protein